MTHLAERAVASAPATSRARHGLTRQLLVFGVVGAASTALHLGGFVALRHALDSAQLGGYAGHDRFGFGGNDQLVRAFPRAGADTAWFGYSHATGKWAAIPRPDWVR